MAQYATAECAGCHVRLPKPEMIETTQTGLAFRPQPMRSYYTASGNLRGTGQTSPFRLQTKPIWLCNDCFQKRSAGRWKGVLSLILVAAVVSMIIYGLFLARDLNLITN